MTYSLAHARTYWHHIPSGLGKHDSRELLQLDDAEFLKLWQRAFDARIIAVPGELLYVMRALHRMTPGKRLLSIGPGMGFHEVLFALGGMKVSCQDLVSANMAVVYRAARLLGTKIAEVFIVLNPLLLPFDHFWMWGVLMHMPASEREELFCHLGRLSHSGSTLTVMAYTQKYARECAEPNNPEVFGRYSDPSVDGLDNPWSEWFDIQRMESLAGEQWQVKQVDYLQDGRFAVWLLHRRIS